MWQKLLTLTALVAMVGLVAAPAASAMEPLAGEGKLTAQGDGIAVLGGKGKVDLSGDGVLWIKDHGGGAVIEVTGYGEKKKFPDGWIQYAGFHGKAHVAGTQIRVVVAGVHVTLTAVGHGEAWLWGHGTHEVNGRSGAWSTADRGARAGF
jgi:hypothetical protein